jgi:hypothetical protein
MTNYVYQPNGSRAGAQIGQAVNVGNAAVSGWLAYRAYRNHLDLTGDPKHAMWMGADSGRRWGNYVWGWLLCIGWTMFGLYSLATTAMGNELKTKEGEPMEVGDYSGYNAAAGLAFCAPIFITFLLVLYNRNIDYSMFKRLPLYWIVKPFQIALIWLPNPAMYISMVLLPLVACNLPIAQWAGWIPPGVV